MRKLCCHNGASKNLLEEFKNAIKAQDYTLSLEQLQSFVIRRAREISSRKLFTKLLLFSFNDQRTSLTKFRLHSMRDCECRANGKLFFIERDIQSSHLTQDLLNAVAPWHCRFSSQQAWNDIGGFLLFDNCLPQNCQKLIIPSAKFKITFQESMWLYGSLIQAIQFCISSDNSGSFNFELLINLNEEENF